MSYVSTDRIRLAVFDLFGVDVTRRGGYIAGERAAYAAYVAACIAYGHRKSDVARSMGIGKTSIGWHVRYADENAIVWEHVALIQRKVEQWTTKQRTELKHRGKTL